MPHHHNWFIRRKGGPVKGPFPEGQIEQYLLLGRFVLTDEVSQDKQEWCQIRMLSHLIPELLIAAKNDDEAREKLEAKRRWADERRGLEQSHEEKDRRIHHASEIQRHDSKDVGLKQNKPIQAFFLIFFVLLAIVLLGYFSFQYTPTDIVSVSNCKAQADPNVNWSHCQKSGLLLTAMNLQGARLNSTLLTGSNLTNTNLSSADLSYADLAISQLSKVNFSNAILVGAVFTNSNLNGANFHNADLSYANLTGANLTQANFSGAKLSNTIWLDGHVCTEASVGTCK